MISDIVAEWRQRRFPPEFRIGPVADPPPSEPPSAPAEERPVPATQDPGTLPDDAAAQVATEVWRAQRRVTGPRAQERPDRAVRMAGKHLAGAADHLGAAGITAHDHDGQPYVLGLELVVLAHEEDPAVTSPTITETVRPTVRRAGRVIQEAEVIVSVPVKDRQDDDQERGQDHA